MTTGEEKALGRRAAAGVLTGIAIGLIIALAIALRPDLFAALG